MNADDERRLANVPAALKLRDIQLFNATFQRPEKSTVGEQPAARQEGMRGVEYVVGDAAINGEQRRVVQFFVRLGTRVVKDVADENPPVYFVIEATFLVEYEMVAPLGEDALKTFADFNAIHNVWPFWRQHVYDVVQRARLPHVDVPLFAGTPS